MQKMVIFGLAAGLALGAVAQVRPVQPVQPVRPVRPVATPTPSWAVQPPAAPAVQAAPAAPAAPAARAAEAVPPEGGTRAWTDSNSNSYSRPGAIPQELVDHPRFDQVPRREFTNAKDYETCVALQKQTGACILLYFHNANDVNQVGLCHWYEKRLLSVKDWQRAIAPYIRISIQLPGNSEAQALAEKFRVKSTPAHFVVKPNDGRGLRFMVFDWSTKEPKLYKAEEAIPLLSAVSTPAYQEKLKAIAP